MDDIKNKNEYRIPQGERNNVAPTVNDAQLAEARSAVEALAFTQGVLSPEMQINPQASELLAIGREIEAQRTQAGYGGVA